MMYAPVGLCVLPLLIAGPFHFVRQKVTVFSLSTVSWRLTTSRKSVTIIWLVYSAFSFAVDDGYRSQTMPGPTQFDGYLAKKQRLMSDCNFSRSQTKVVCGDTASTAELAQELRRTCQNARPFMFSIARRCADKARKN
jgi:hypothetical protein